MTRHIYTYELLSFIKKPAIYIYAFTFFSIALLSLLGTGGYFDGVSESDEQVRLLNSPLGLVEILQYFNKFFLFLLPAVIGSVIYKDYKKEVYAIIYSYPVTKKEYLLGKLLSGLTIVILITLSTGLAFIIGERMLGAENPNIGSSGSLGLMIAYVVWIIPNMIIYGSFVLMVVAALRNVYAGFIAIIFLFLLQIIVDNLFAGSPMLLSIFDPFGQNATIYETQHWTIAEQNTKYIPLAGVVLWNRFFWLGVIAVLGYIFYRRFALSHENPFSLKRIRQTHQVQVDVETKVKFRRGDINYDLSFAQKVRALMRLSQYDFLYIINNWMFLILGSLGSLALVFAIGRITNTGEMILLPLTRLILSVPMFFYTSIIILITFVLSGMLVHRSKASKSQDLVDTTVTPSWVLLGSRVVALIKMQAVLLMIMIVIGILIQLYNGHHHLELDLYFFHLFGLVFPTMVIWAIFSVFVHTLIPQVYMGIFLLILVWIGKDQLHEVGLSSHIIKFNSPPQLSYSDMSGFGFLLYTHYLVTAYWLAFSCVLLVGTHLLWSRGYTYTLMERWMVAKSRFNNSTLIAIIGFGFFITSLGYKILDEESKSISSSWSSDASFETFVSDFKKYENCDQPTITDLKLSLNIYPDSKKFDGTGQYILTNMTDQYIDTLLIKSGYDEITDYHISNAELIERNERFQLSVYKLAVPISPQDSMIFNFSFKNKPNTWFEKNSGALKNGTFLRTDILPRLGYFFNEELIMPDHPQAHLDNYYTPDAHLLHMETIISTSSDQLAIAPGYLEEQWTDGDRTFYKYKTKSKVKLNAAYNSGIYDKYEEQYDGVNLAIYYQRSHHHNNENIMNGLKESLSYNTRYFGPYQHSEARVIEYPLTEGTYATTMANSIPMSELRFVINNRAAKDRTDLSFYVPAHELTHQWWGNQVVPARALGATMLTESISEYISLNVYRNFYSDDIGLDFLRLQHKRYLRGRTTETNQEQPLYLVSSAQDYISYGKGAIAFNTLAHLWTEENLNQVLSSFLQKWKYRTDAYPSSLDLIDDIRICLPQDLQYIITDLFLSTTLYDNKIGFSFNTPVDSTEITSATLTECLFDENDIPIEKDDRSEIEIN